MDTLNLDWITLLDGDTDVGNPGCVHVSIDGCDCPLVEGTAVTVRLRTSLLDGTAADPTTLALRVRRPDGTRVDIVDLVRDGLGRWHVDLVLDQAGRWAFEAIADGHVRARCLLDPVEVLAGIPAPV